MAAWLISANLILLLINTIQVIFW